MGPKNDLIFKAFIGMYFESSFKITTVRKLKISPKLPRITQNISFCNLEKPL